MVRRMERCGRRFRKWKEKMVDYYIHVIISFIYFSEKKFDAALQIFEWLHAEMPDGIHTK